MANIKKTCKHIHQVSMLLKKERGGQIMMYPTGVCMPAHLTKEIVIIIPGGGRISHVPSYSIYPKLLTTMKA